MHSKTSEHRIPQAGPSDLNSSLFSAELTSALGLHHFEWLWENVRIIGIMKINETMNEMTTGTM